MNRQIRTNDEDDKLVEKLKKKTGLNFTALVKRGLRLLAEREGIELREDKKES